jgi:hypothetical protein
MELNRILIGRMASSIIREMLSSCKLGSYLCLPEDGSRNVEFERVAHANAPKGEDGPLIAASGTLLSALFSNFEDAERFQVYFQNLFIFYY